MSTTEQPTPMGDTDPTSAVCIGHQLAEEASRTGVEPVSATVSRRQSLEVTFSDGCVVKFNTLFAGGDEVVISATVQVLWVLDFKRYFRSGLERRVARVSDEPLTLTRARTPAMGAN